VPRGATQGCRVANGLFGSYRRNLVAERAQSLQNSTSSIPASRRLFRRINSALLRWGPLYRLYLKMKFGTGRLAGSPGPWIANGTLQSRAEWQDAFENARKLRVPLHRGAEKNWDHLAAVSTILAWTNTSACILDAGGEFYSNVLPALFVYGYRDLYGINLSFTDRARRGPIRYLPGDITRAPFASAFFDAITCLSVIEHGVPLESYFREMHRLLKPGGLLITSTDYYPVPIDTRGMVAHGCPVRIFSKQDMQAALSLAEGIGFKRTGDLDLECLEKPIRWDAYGLEYTFVLFTLQKEP
jgi:SAM-dependent methyltransferase